MLKDIKSMYLDEIIEDFTTLNLPKFRATQVYKWLQQTTSGFDEMTNISKDIRSLLSTQYFIPNVKIEKKYKSQIDGTVKYLLKLYDGNIIEAVLMKYKHGYSVCLSSQIGCKMGCKFCASTKNGFVRSLYASEIISQIQTINIDNDIRISNVVLMGIGEPLDNFDNIIRFLKLVSNENGLNIGLRHISLSTCGVADKIYDLAQYNFPITLSISLHATNDKDRSSIMPINNKFNIETLIEAIKFYQNKNGRRVSFEYSLIENVNDSKKCADELIKISKRVFSHVNLIPVNPIKEYKFNKPNKENIIKFKNYLEKNGVNATIRRTLGQDINASCGQLRQNYLENQGAN